MNFRQLSGAIGSDRGYSAVERGAVSSRENSRRASLSGRMSASAPFHSVKKVSYDLRADSKSRLIAAARAWPRYASGYSSVAGGNSERQHQRGGRAAER